MYTFGAVLGFIVGIVIGYVAAHYYYKDKNLINYVLKDMSDEEVKEALDEILSDDIKGEIKKAKAVKKKNVK